jgi:hypothetical protein
MPNPDLVELYKYCYNAVENEMYMRDSVGEMTGRFIRDDSINHGYLYSTAWILMTKEQAVLHFPPTYGRPTVVEMRDVWGNLLGRWAEPGYYYLNRPGITVAKLVAQIAVNPYDEQDYGSVYDLQQDMSITDITLGGNEWEGEMPLIYPKNPIPSKPVQDLSAREFFAIANVIALYNTPNNPDVIKDLYYTQTASTSELDKARTQALYEMGL